MLKLTKKQSEELAGLKSAVEEASGQVAAEIELARQVTTKAVASVNEKIEALNTAIEALNAFREERNGEAQSYYDDKSERWQESDRGNAYAAFVGEWEVECPTVDEVEEPSFDEVDVDVPEWPEEFEG